MKISLGSWAFSFGPYASHPVPFEKIVKRLAEAHYDGIEVCGFPPHVSVDDYPTRESRRELARMIANCGLGVSGYSSDLSAVNPIVAGQKQKYLALFRRNVELCAEIGSPLIRVDSVAAPGSIDDANYKKAFDQVAAAWREAAAMAQDYGVLMTWEFEPGFVFNAPSEVVAMHELVDHPNFKLMFDTCHAYMCAVVGARQHGPKETLPGGVKELLQKLSGRIGSIHLIDSDGTLYGEETSTHRPFGQGFINFEELVPRLLEVPDIEWWTIDMCFWAGAWELIDSSREFVVNLLRYHEALR